ncbi:MAG: hypothetical protein Q9220_003360 [cf. Caloplaca sp. 1 TL-2023]
MTNDEKSLEAKDTAVHHDSDSISQLGSHGLAHAKEKALVRKIDLFLLPTIWLMYLLSYIDRTKSDPPVQRQMSALMMNSIGNAKIAGMQDDLHLSSSQYSISLILIALRFIVGILEAGFAPGVLLLLSSWYKREEQSKRFAVYISAAILSGAFGGLLAGSITKDLEGVHGIRGWRWLFIVEGAASIGWACLAHFILLDFPLTSKHLSEDERQLASERLLVDEESRTRDEHRLGPLQAIKRSLTNWRVWLFTAGYMVIVGSSTLSYFYPTLVEGLGYKAYKAQYMVLNLRSRESSGYS